jgi:hypothetical protein
MVMALRGTFSSPKKSLAGEVVERDETRARVFARARFVEPHVTRSADAQDLDVDAAEVFDFLFVLLAIVPDGFAGDRAVGHVDVGAVDVDVVEQVLVHEADVALQRVGLHGEVFVEVEAHDVLERQTLFAVQADQFRVDAGGRGPGGQAQHGALAGFGFGADEVGDFAGDRAGRGDVGGVDGDGHLLHGREHFLTGRMADDIGLHGGEGVCGLRSTVGGTRAVNDLRRTEPSHGSKSVNVSTLFNTSIGRRPLTVDHRLLYNSLAPPRFVN